ncbi:MAG: hypothetical protein L6Q71_08020 [Planctomycetes bacterium]|nr:hypothetical protein [Planctomycetota bacterium]
MTSLMLFTGLITISTLVFGCSTQPHNESPWEQGEPSVGPHCPPGDEIILCPEDFKGLEDWRSKPFQDLAGYLSTRIDKDGYPTGLQISDDLPEDHILYRAGFRGGDVVKSINGTPISEIQMAKNYVMKLRDEGVTAFVIGFERNFADRTKFIRVVGEK